MKITVKNDFRNLKEGDIFDFSERLSEKGCVCIVGNNGSGKSTILQALRGYKNDQPTKSMFEYDFKKLSQNVEIEHNYEKIFHLDRIKDDGSNMNVSYDAVEYLQSGGYQTRHSSHGQSTMLYLNNFLNKVQPQIIEDKTLLVFDEVDNGFSLDYLSKYFNLIEALVSKYKCHILVITHNPFFIVKSTLVFDMESKEFVDSQKYLMNKTKFKMEQIY